MSYNKEDCTGIYLIFFKSIESSIRSQSDLIMILRESGRHVDKSILNRYWNSDTKEISFEEYLKICREIPVITKTELVKFLKKLDESNSGFLDKTEFIKTMTDSGMKLSRREIIEIVNKADPNATGKLNFEDLATLLLSNLEPFRVLARSKLPSKEGAIVRKQAQGESSVNPSASARERISNKVNRRSLDGDDDDVVTSGRGSNEKKDSMDGILIKKDLSSRFEYREPKNLKSWNKHILRGCIFLGDVTSAIAVQNPNIEYHTYRVIVNSNANVLISMAPLTLLQNIDLKKIPDLGFIILNKNGEVISLSMPMDSSGSVYYSGSLNAGSYSVIPFTTGAKLKARMTNASDNFQNVIAIKKGAKGEMNFTPEMKSVLEDVFKICDIDGNGYLSKEEYKLYFERTNEDDWNDELWKDVKNLIQLYNGEMPFSEFSKLIMKEIVEDNGDTSSLFVTLDLFGYSDKCLLEEAFPFSMTFQVENSDFLAKCLGISNESALLESSLCDFVIQQGEKFDSKIAWRDCSVYTWLKGGRFLIAMENNSSISKKIPLRLNVNMSKSINVAVYKDKVERDISISSATKILAVHGVPIETKVSVSFNCLVSRL